MRFIFAGLLCASLMSTALSASGQSPPAPSAEDRAQAQALFDRAAALMKAGDYAAACPKLEASLQLFDGIGTRGKLAQCYEQVGRIASAWAMYREVEALATKAGDGSRASVARDAANALETRLPHLTLTVGRAQRIEGLVLKRNGTAVAPGAWGAAIAVDPGQHALEARAPGHAPWIHELEIKEGESQTVEVPRLEALPARATPATKPEAAAPAPAEQGPWRPVAMVAAGAGVVSLAVGGYFGLRAKSKWDGAFDDGHCDSSSNTCDAEGQDMTDEARSAATLSNVFIGAGAVLAAGGVALWFLAPKERAPRAARLRVAPVATPGNGGVWVQGVF